MFKSRERRHDREAINHGAKKKAMRKTRNGALSQRKRKLVAPRKIQKKLTVEASAASGLVIHYDMCEKKGRGGY